MIHTLYDLDCIWLNYDAVGDEDDVDWLEVCFGFEFGEGVIGEAAVAVISGDCGLAAAGLVICDDINDDDCDDVHVVVVVFVLEKHLQSLFI